MKNRAVGVVVLLLSSPALAAASWSFDFGPGEVAPGFVPVTGDLGYEVGRGFGFVDPARAVEHDMAEEKGALAGLDSLSRDRVFGGGSFRMDLPDGRYELLIFTGGFTGAVVQDEVHDHQSGELWVRAEDQEVYHRPAVALADYFDATGPYFGSAGTFYHRDQSLWETFVARHFPVVRATVDVTGGSLELTLSDNFSLNGLVVWADEGEAVDPLAEIERFRRTSFDGHYVYESALGAARDVKLETPAEDLVVFACSPMAHVYPESVPSAEDLGRPAQVVAARGERALVQVAGVPGRELGSLRLQVGDLLGPRRGLARRPRIPASAVEVRYARYDYFTADGRTYSVEPKLLVLRSDSPADPGVARAFYLRIAVPLDAEPGLYEGQVALSAPDGTRASLPLQVRVLPFELPAQPLAVGGFSSLPSAGAMRLYRADEAQSEAFADLERRWNAANFALMRDLGMTHVSTNIWWRPFVADEQGVVSPREPALAYTLVLGDLVRDAGFDSFTMFGVGWSALMNAVPGFPTRRDLADRSAGEIRFPDEALVPAAAVMKALYDTAEERGWPEMPFYASDELGTEGAVGADYGEALVQFLGRARELSGHDFSLLSTTLGFRFSERMLPFLDIIVSNAAWPLNPTTITAARDAGARLWLYNLGESRLSFGFYPWRVGAGARLQWAWDFNGRSGDPWFGMTGFPTQYDVVMGPDLEAVPSYGWLVLAGEGAKDRQYVQLLLDKLAQQPEGPAAEEARRVLEELSQRVSETYLDPRNSWQPGTYDYFRWRLAQAVMAFD